METSKCRYWPWEKTGCICPRCKFYNHAKGDCTIMIGNPPRRKYASCKDLMSDHLCPYTICDDFIPVTEED